MRQPVRKSAWLAFGVALLLGTGNVLGEGLPGGASSLNETHGDWAVACAVPQGDVRCVLTQTQVNTESRQRILAIEIAADEEGAGGTLVLPFGLALDEGVQLSLDEAAEIQSLRFSTCLPAGCLVPLHFTPDMLAALRAGTTLTLKARASDSGQEVGFAISLTGFTAALQRATELTRE